LALTSSTSGGRWVGIVLPRNKATEFIIIMIIIVIIVVVVVVVVVVVN
jgi:hypothetical protein